MSFLYPSFLWALTAVLVPVVIHLFNFRRYKKVYFSNVRFLRELQLETRSRSRLKELLVLACRCLAIIALVLAFARPYLADSKNVVPPESSVAIYVDNSFSMANVGRQGPLLALARKHAADLVKAHGQSARFYIVTNDFAGSEQRWRTHDDALDFIGQIDDSPVARTLSSVLARQQAFMARSSRKAHVTYVLSDAQRSTFDLERVNADSTQRVSILPLVANQVNNLVADSCWFDSPVRQKGFRQKLFATITNRGSSNIESGSAKLFLNERQVAMSSFSVPAGATSTVVFTFFQETEGFNFGRLVIEDYPVTFDDQLYFAYDAGKRMNVVLISGNTTNTHDPFTALFGNDSVFVFRSFSEQTIDYGAFTGADLIVLNQPGELGSGLLAELQKYAAAGGGIVVIPAEQITASWNQGLMNMGLPPLGEKDTTSMQVGRIDPSSGFFAGVFEKAHDRVNLPVVRTRFRIPPAGGTAERLLVMDNGDDLLISQKWNNATVFLFTSPLLGNHSNFTRHALFVPAFYRIAILSMTQPPLYYSLHPDVMITMKGRAGESEQPPRITGRSAAAAVIPERRTVNNTTALFPRSQLTLPGYYILRHEDEDILPLAFNYTRIESDLSFYDDSALREIAAEKGWNSVQVISDSGETIRSQALLSAGNNQLWKLFILLALVFFLAECLLLRFLR